MSFDIGRGSVLSRQTDAAESLPDCCVNATGSRTELFFILPPDNMSEVLLSTFRRVGAQRGLLRVTS